MPPLPCEGGGGPLHSCFMRALVRLSAQHPQVLHHWIIPEVTMTCCLPVVLLPLVPPAWSLHNFLPLPPHFAVSSFHREVDLVLHTLQIHPLPD